MAVGVWQRKLFYPSLLMAFFLTMLSTLTYQTYPVLPFMAVNVLFNGGAADSLYGGRQGQFDDLGFGRIDSSHKILRPSGLVERSGKRQVQGDSLTYVIVI